MNVWRRTLQVSVALLFIAVPFLNAYGVQWFYGNLLSFKAGGLPLADPLAVAQVGMAAGSFTGDMLLGAGLVLLLAVLLGPVFCSWPCFSALCFAPGSVPSGCFRNCCIHARPAGKKIRGKRQHPPGAPPARHFTADGAAFL